MCSDQVLTDPCSDLLANSFSKLSMKLLLAKLQ